MTPEGRKIWNSPAGASLMRAMLEEKPVDRQDEETVKALIETSKDGRKRRKRHLPEIERG